MSRIRLVYILTALAAVMLMSAVRAETLPAVVRIGTSGSIHYKNGEKVAGGHILSTRIAREKWLEDQLGKLGVKLEWVPVTGEYGPLINEAFAAGRIDFANIGDLPSIVLNASGVRTQLIVPNGRGGDLFLIVPPNSKANSLEDLIGKRIIVQTARPWELGFRKLLRDKGLKRSDFRIFSMDQNAGMAALAGEKVDAFFHTSGYLIEERKIGRIIWSSNGSLDYKIRGSELWVAKPFVDKYPEITQIVATAYVKAQHWISQDENMEHAIREGILNGTPESVVRKNYADDIDVLPWRDQWIPLFDEFLINYYRTASEIAHEGRIISRPLNADELFNTRFLDEALRELDLTDYWKPYTAGGTQQHD